MDENLKRMIQHDHIDLKHAFKEHKAIAEVLEVKTQFVQSIIDNLHGSGEFGFMEVKEHSITRIMSVLEDGKYKSLSDEQLTAMIQSATTLILVTLLTRKSLSGETVQANSTKTEQNREDYDIKTIISMTTTIITEHPNLKNDQSYKFITRILTKYNSELIKMKQMVKNIAPENRNQFLNNANKQLAEFSVSMNRKFESLKQTAMKLGSSKDENIPIISLIDSTKISSLYNKQVEMFSRLRSSLRYIVKERYRFQSLMEELIGLKNGMLDAIRLEEKKLFSLLTEKNIDSGKYGELIQQITENIVRLLEIHYKNR